MNSQRPQHPLLWQALTGALCLMLFACGGETTADGPLPVAGEACRDGIICAAGLECVNGTCEDTTVLVDASTGDANAATPDVADHDDATTGPDAEDLEDAEALPDTTAPDVSEDVTVPVDGAEETTSDPADIEAGDAADGSSVEEDADSPGGPDAAEGCTVPIQCADAFDVVPACQVPTCDTATGQCILASVTDATPCDDGNACSYNDECSDGACVGIGADCEDDNPCTTDTCTATGCENTPKVGTCDDGNLCTVDDFCIAGTCLGDAVNCSSAPANECLDDAQLRAYEATGICDVNSGLCDYAYLDVTCFEGCVDGGCASDICEVAAAGTACDDGLSCTLNDSCTFEGTCVGIDLDCSEFDGPCLDATCDGQDGSCKSLALTDGTLCDDADACTLSDHCESGECVAGSVTPCDDGNPCTDDSCDPLTGGCLHLPNTGSCDDNDVCTEGDSCSGGFCFGLAIDCGDDNECTDDICNSDGSCSHIINTAPCDDDDVCTDADVCSDGVCAGLEIACEDGNPCTEDACEAGIGCVVVGDSDIELPCYYGDESLIGVGACKEGTRSCSAGALGPCANQVLPTEELCDNEADDDCDGEVDEPQCSEPPVGLANAMVDWSIVGDSPGMLMGQWADLNNGAYQQAVGGYMNRPPNTSGQVEVALGPLKATGTFSTTAYPADWVSGIIRNPDVYADDPIVRAVVQVRDALGRPYVSPTKVELRLMVQGADDVVTPCYVGATSTCEIAAAIPDGWFSSDIPVAVSARFELPSGESTGLSTVILAKKPPVEALPDPGVVMTLPHGPQYASRTFTVPIFAVASDSVIESFDVKVPFDPAVLTVKSVTVDPRYSGVSNPKFDEVLIVGVREVDTPFEDATGQVHLADIEFQVRADAPEGATVQFAPTVTSLFDLQNVALTGPSGAYQVHIQSGGPADTTGLIEVATDPLRGIYAVAENNELFNVTGIYTDTPTVTSPVHVFAVHAYGPDVNVAAASECASAFDANIKMTAGCVATLDETTTSPTSSVTVTVDYEDASTTLPFRVWQPVYPVSVKVDDNFLERISGVLNDDCSAERFQETRVHVDVSFRHSNTGTDVVTGRLDDYIAFSTGNTSNLMEVEGNTIRGLASGQATVSAIGPNGAMGSADVIISDTVTNVTGIDVVVPTDIVFDNFSPAPPFLHTATSLAQATLVQAFNFEGKEGPVLAYATFEDNRRMPITAEMGLSVSSLAPNALAVLEAPYRAVTLDSGSGDMIDARWTVCGDEVASGVGYIEMALPAPVGAEITLSTDALARSETDAAALAGLPICADVEVTLLYETGETKDFTLDERTFYDDIGGDPFNLFELQAVSGPDGKTQGIQVCSVAGDNFGAFALLVSFTHAPELEQFIVPVNIVKAEGLALGAYPWPAYPGSTDSYKTNFDQLEATGSYQQGVLSTILALSDGTIVDVSANPSTTYGLVPNSGVFSIANSHILSASGAGAAQVTATFGDQFSSPLEVNASDAGVDVDSLSLDFPSTFKGVAGWAKEIVSVTATFEDGTVLTDAQEVAGLLAFEVSHPEAMSIAASGEATLLANERVMVTVTATAQTSNTSGATTTACNLEPSVGDIDLGNLFGIAHPDVLPGEDFTMPLRVNTGSLALGALDVTFEYDPAVIQAVSGGPGSGWPGGQLEITLNDPPGEVHIVAAASVGSNAKGNALEIATINFQGLKSQETNLTLIQGSIRKLLSNAAEPTAIGPALGIGETRDIVAGHGWLDPDCANGLEPSEILGNSDGDCEFSVADVSFGLHYLADLVAEGSVSAFQESALDADQDGDVNVADVVYLIRVLAGKFRFATLAVTENGGLSDTTTLEVTLRDAAGQVYGDQAQVWLELATTVNTGMTITTGTQIASTDDGFVVEASYVGDGVYRMSATNMTEEEDIGVAMIVRTTDGLGESGDDRVVALHGSSWLNPGADFVPFAPVNFGGNAAPLCLPGQCVDGNPCTDDACDPAVGCVFTNNNDFCDDNDECTEVDRCTDGTCAGTFIPGCGDDVFCGDDSCDEGETCSSCEYDCGVCPAECGDGECSWEEDCASCSDDCGSCAGEGDCCTANDTPGCEDGAIAAQVCAINPYCCTGKWEENCAIDAITNAGLECESCGNLSCDEGETCLNCSSDCECECGDDLCTVDEDCGSCSQDCGECPPVCGDGTCNGTEVCDSCIEDCGECDPFCGDLTCDDMVMGACSDDGSTACTTDSDCTTPGATCDGYYQKEGCCADCQECPHDCGGACEPYCGDDTCHLSNGETCQNCELDCGECGGDCCVAHDGIGCDQSAHADIAPPAADALTTCVCELEPECCTLGWGYQCLMAAAIQCDTPCPYCGDDVCSADFGEDMTTCKVDCCPNGVCPEFCGNGTCGPGAIGTCSNSGDTPVFCVDDGGCTDGGVCDGFIAAETCSSCAEDCGQCSSSSCCADATGSCTPGVDCGGCNDPAVMACVCDDLGLSSCCGSTWNEICVQMAFQNCAPTCEASCGDGICTTGPLGTPDTLGTCSDGAAPPQYCTDDTGCSGGATCEGFIPGTPAEPLETCVTCEADCGECVTECGNDICEDGETCESCGDDCGPCIDCGDGICVWPENCDLCEDDCGECSDDCEDDICQLSEDAYSCPADCLGVLCGDGVCVGVLDGNSSPHETNEGCPEDCPVTCGDGFCAPIESCLLCEDDCGACPDSVCGDGICAGESFGEGCGDCPEDCSVLCVDVCTAYGPVCSGACDPVAETTGCGTNLACVPTETTEESEAPGGGTVPAGTWTVNAIATTGNGICGMGFDANAGFVSDGCTVHDDCCVFSPETNETFCGKNNGMGCLKVQGIATPGICGRACNPETAEGCAPGSLCELSEFTADAVGVCIPSGQACDPSNPVATGCPTSHKSCLALRDEVDVGACFEGCSAPNATACDGVVSGEPGDRLSCLPRSEDRFHEGTCVGGGASGCLVTEPDPCTPGGGDRCAILGGGAMGGYSFYCTSPAGSANTGDACTQDAGCQPGNLCFGGTCRPACSSSVSCAGAGTCTPIGTAYGAPSDAVSVCVP